MIDVTIPKELFNEVYLPYLQNHSRVQIYYGGSSSGKSVFLAQRVVYDLLAGGRNYLICRAVGRYVPKSVWQEVESVIKQWGLAHLFEFKISGRIIKCINGYEAIFTGLDDTEKLKSIRPAIGAITDVWVEEATEIDLKDIKTLLKRQRGGSEEIPKRLTLSFNPILHSHWIYTSYFEEIEWEDDQAEYQTDELSILKTWYIHNAWNTTADIRDLEDESDPYYYDVYTLGNWGVLGNVIFTNWRVTDLTPMLDQFTDQRHGLDFGYAADPTSAHSYHVDKMRKKIYVFKEIYETRLTNPEIADRLHEVLGTETEIESADGNTVTEKRFTDSICCDSAEPKSIAELQRAGINAYGAKKGQGSVLHGIQWLKQYEIIIDKRCINAKNDIMSMKWKEGRDGQPVSPPKPVGKNDHFIDDMRYALEDDINETWLI